MKFYIQPPNEGEGIGLSASHLWNGVYGLDRIGTYEETMHVTGERWLELLQKVIHGLKAKAVEIQFRTAEGHWPTELTRELGSIGFQKKHHRIEYRCDVIKLPKEIGSPLKWEAIFPLGTWSEIQAADFLRQVALGDPDFDPGENTRGLVRGYLSDAVLNTGPECVQIGFLNNEAIALVIAQVNPKTKWSRITYMGMLETHRGRKLGKWIHRHGFEMIRKQGGTLYQGGTVAENTTMQKLFITHGCAEFRRMQEWIYKFSQPIA
jgi:hypothetical protein